MDEEKIWSFLRKVISQGAAIRDDYKSGKYSYEQYSARIDAAAAERTEQFLEIMKTPNGLT